MLFTEALIALTGISSVLAAPISSDSGISILKRDFYLNSSERQCVQVGPDPWAIYMWVRKWGTFSDHYSTDKCAESLEQNFFWDGPRIRPNKFADRCLTLVGKPWKKGGRRLQMVGLEPCIDRHGDEYIPTQDCMASAAFREVDGKLAYWFR